MDVSIFVMSRLITQKRVSAGGNLYRRVHHCGQVHLCCGECVVMWVRIRRNFGNLFIFIFRPGDQKGGVEVR
jgi:hypothetical protein